MENNDKTKTLPHLSAEFFLWLWYFSEHAGGTVSHDKGDIQFWIEDKIDNAISGRDWGLSSILIEHGHNMNFDCNKEEITKVKNWKEIFELLN